MYHGSVRVGAGVLGLAGALHASGVAAQLPPDGQPIRSSDYTLDIYAGPVLSSTRVTGLGGAFVAIGDGTEGGLLNPAAPAVRPKWSVDWFDYWLGLGTTLPFDVDDFFNTGIEASEIPGLEEVGFAFLNPAINLQFGRFGLGVNLDMQTFTVDGAAPDASGAIPSIRATFMTTHLQVAYQFMEGQLLAGAGALVFWQNVTGRLGTELLGENLYSAATAGAEVGAIWRPNDEPYRMGLSFESPLQTSPDGDSGDIVINDAYMPLSIYKPWKLRAGLAYQAGDRPLNPRWSYGSEVVEHELGEVADQLTEDELEDYEKALWRRMRCEARSYSQRFILVTAQIDLIGAAKNAVSYESLVLQRVRRSGEHVSLSVHFGAETVLVPDRLRGRAGFYLEPGRVSDSVPRMHWTGGLDVLLGNWDVFGIWPEDYLWQIVFAVDLAPRYQVFSFTIGGWY